MVLYGVVHVVIAWLVAQVALGDHSRKADSKGALAEVAGTAVGPLALWGLAVGLSLFVVWQVVEGVWGFTFVRGSRRRAAKRVGAGARAVTAATIAYSAFQFASGRGGGDSTGTQRELTARVLVLPFGQVLVGAVAVGVAVVAVVVLRKGVKRSFERDLDLSELPVGSRWVVERVGRVGWVGKGVAYAVIAVVLGATAVTADAGRSGGLDNALRALAAQPYGVVVLGVVAVGFAAFGVYCVAAAKAHRG
ncbi:DUF1206 domain-containing protein [Actinokineospora pegani]|uniref:DUF1206 domain-containing protein n=1 Tax=Actinokineospora pegani TaxID=2654637 RepID=UPI0012EA4A6E|nr:DUF1206 domain-containing protein [Actinokineospora pegani]